jgi:hypothetical protein
MSPTMRRSLMLTLVPFVAGACLITSPDGSVTDCRQVGETYRHYGRLQRGRPATWHTHTRNTWRCSQVSGPTTTTTVAPSVTVVSVEYVNPYQLLWTVDANVGARNGPFSMAWVFGAYTTESPMSPTGVPGRYTFTTNYSAYVSGTYDMSVRNFDGFIASVAHTYTAPPLCGAAGGAGTAC